VAARGPPARPGRRGFHRWRRLVSRDHPNP